MLKSLYNKTDERVITELLRLLNKVASKDRELRRIKDHDKWLKADRAFQKADPRTKVVLLVEVLNELKPRLKREMPPFFNSELRGINGDMKKCLVFPQIKTRGGREWDVLWASPPGASPAVRAYREMVPKILSLHVRGLLSAVRECESYVCGEWFFAEHGKKKFHSELCRSRDHYANLTPQAKAHRRKLMRNKMRTIRAKKMREYRALEKKRSERALAVGDGVELATPAHKILVVKMGGGYLNQFCSTGKEPASIATSGNSSGC